jgi:hypothetical protein
MDVALIAGFLVVDFLFFHDLFKRGEATTVPQYMTGVQLAGLRGLWPVAVEVGSQLTAPTVKGEALRPNMLQRLEPALGFRETHSDGRACTCA